MFAKVGRFLPALALLALVSVFFGASAHAEATDITSTITELGGYWTAIKVVAIGIVLFVLGRKILKKL